MEKQLAELKVELVAIKKLLIGNGKIGIAEMARRAFESIQQYKQTKSGFLDWLFRALILIVLGYIATKIGLK